MKKKKVSKVNMDDFIQLNEINRRHAIHMGTIVYLIDNKIITGKIIIRPRLLEGKTIKAKGDPHFKELNVVKGESKEEYSDNLVLPLNYAIKNKMAYVKKNEKLIKYEYL